MADPFVAEVRMFPFNFAPRGWAWCNGQLLPLSQNTALFSLLGVNFGGDGRSNFALPDLQDRTPLQPRQGPGLSWYELGQQGGQSTVTLLSTEIPAHTHTLSAAQVSPTSLSPAGNVWTGDRRANAVAYTSAAPDTEMSPNALGPSGGSMPHNNRQPYLGVHFCIALQGVYPPRG
jgi:microcystin-dependent protein